MSDFDLPVSAEDPLDSKEVLLTAAAHMITTLIPVANHLLSNACSKEDRNRLHELAGSGSIFQLTCLMSNLCSETARQLLMKRSARLQDAIDYGLPVGLEIPARKSPPKRLKRD